jgi:hypothetical protein
MSLVGEQMKTETLVKSRYIVQSAEQVQSQTSVVTDARKEDSVNLMKSVHLVRVGNTMSLSKKKINHI